MQDRESVVVDGDRLIRSCIMSDGTLKSGQLCFEREVLEERGCRLLALLFTLPIHVLATQSLVNYELDLPRHRMPLLAAQ